MRYVLLFLLALAGCSGVHTVSDAGAPSDAAVAPDALAGFCREIFGYQVNEGGRLGFHRADWPCPAIVVDRASFDACVAFLQTTARTEREVETCEAAL